MTRRERLSGLYSQFDNSAKEFCEATGGLFCKISDEYKGGRFPENLTFRRAKIFYNTFAVEFKYTAHTRLGFMHSVLEAIVFPGKSEDTSGIPLPFVGDYFDRDYFPPAIPFVTDEESMKQAFLHIGAALKEMLSDLSYIPLDANKIKQLYAFYYGDLEPVFHISGDEQTQDEDAYAFYNSEAFYRFMTMRLTSNPFIQILKGDNERAIKELKKCKVLFGYERRLLKRLEEGKTPSFTDITAVTNNLDAFGNSGARKFSIKEFFSLFVSWFIIGAAASAVYAAIFLVFYFLAKLDSVYLMGAINNMPICFLGGFFTGIAASYYLRFWFFKLLFKKDYDQFEKLDHIANGATSDKIMKCLLAFIVICSLAACVLFPNQNIKFSEYGFTDNTELFTRNGNYYDYSEIERIYYRPDRVNGFGQLLDYPSYVLVLKDGTEIDFYENDEIENYETKLLDFLAEMGVKIEKE